MRSSRRGFAANCCAGCRTDRSALGALIGLRESTLGAERGPPSQSRPGRRSHWRRALARGGDNLHWMRQAVLAPFLLVAAIAAQDAWNETLRQRREQGKDLIELRYRRTAQGLLEVASGEGGARGFERLFPDDNPLGGSLSSTGMFGVLMLFCHGSGDLLAMTDAERHLQRAQVGTSAMDLRQFLATPPPAGDAVRARVDLLDRMVAIDLLRRGGHKGAVAEWTALVTREDTPAPLRARAAQALAAFGRGASPAP